MVKLVASRTGIPEDKAKMAVELVVQHLKVKLPTALGGQIDSALAGGGGVGETLRKLGIGRYRNVNGQ
jgi:hypothetical protein